MRQKIKSVSLASLMVLSVMSSLLIASVSVSASTVVITEAVQIVDGGTASDSQAAVGSDSSGNVHLVWTRNNLHLYYSMISPRGETLIDATQITNSGLHKVWHPDLAVDEYDRIHVVWADKAGQHAIMYTALSPWAAPMDGMASDDGPLRALADGVGSKDRQASIEGKDARENLRRELSANYSSTAYVERLVVDFLKGHTSRHCGRSRRSACDGEKDRKLRTMGQRRKANIL